MLRAPSKAKTVTAIAPMPAPSTQASLPHHSPGNADNSNALQFTNIQYGSSSPNKSNVKAIPTERDSVNALLSLGRDLQAEEAEAAAAAAAAPVDQHNNPEVVTIPVLPSNIKISVKRPPHPILPEVLAAKQPKKRQRRTNTANPRNSEKDVTLAHGPGLSSTLPDFWFWLPDGEAIGEWDV
jgi:hypothetical protein